jgi:hypothetical protein
MMAKLKEINEFASVLETAIPAHDSDVIALAVHTVGAELRDLVEQFPGVKDTTVTDGLDKRLAARRELKNMVLLVRAIGVDAAAGRFDDAATGYQTYLRLTAAPVPIVLRKAQQWSLFNPAVHDAHYAGLRQVLQTARQLQR